MISIELYKVQDNPSPLAKILNFKILNLILKRNRIKCNFNKMYIFTHTIKTKNFTIYENFKFVTPIVLIAFFDVRRNSTV